MESALLFDSGVRVWYKREFKRLQSFMDKCYRYVWGNRNGQLLRRRQELGVNTEYVGCKEDAGYEEFKVEDREEGVREDWSRDEDGR